MAIDKSIRQYYDSGMLVKKRADGKRPGYAFAGTGGRTSSSSGARGDSPEDRYRYSVGPTPTPVFQPPQRVATYTPEPDTRDHEEQAVGTPFENIYTAPTDFAPTTGEGGLGEGDYIDPQTLQDMEDIASWAAEEDVPLDIEHVKDTQTRIKEGIESLGKDYDPSLTKEQKKQVNAELATYYGDKPGTKYDLETGKKKPGFLKTAGKIVLGILAPQLLAGTEFAPLYRGYQGIKQFEKLGLLPKLDFEKQLAGDKYWKRGDVSKKKLAREGEGSIPPTLAEEITGRGLESGQKMLGLDPERIQQIYQGRDLLKQTIESGMYQGRQLNMNEIKILQEHMMKLDNLIQNIESYQVRTGSAHGGRIDKALGGRSRDI